MIKYQIVLKSNNLFWKVNSNKKAYGYNIRKPSLFENKQGILQPESLR